MQNLGLSNDRNTLRDIATFNLVHVYNAPVSQVARALQVSRQTIYRRLAAVLARARAIQDRERPSRNDSGTLKISTGS